LVSESGKIISEATNKSDELVNAWLNN
jgi:hypothetical protein